MKELCLRVIRWALRLYYYRVQLVTAGITLALPALVCNQSIGGMVRGVFDIDTGTSLFLTGLMSMLLMWGMRLPARLVRIYGPERFDFKAKGLESSSGPGVPNWLRDAGWFLISLAPMIAVLIQRVSESGWTGSEGISGLRTVLYLSLGIGLAFILYIGAVWIARSVGGVESTEVMGSALLRKLESSADEQHSKYSRAKSDLTHASFIGQIVGIIWTSCGTALRWLPDSLLTGITRPIPHATSEHDTPDHLPPTRPPIELLVGHFLLMAYTLAATLILLGIGLMSPSEVAPLVSLLALLLAACLVCSGIAFFFDRIPVPVTLLLAIWVFGVSLFWRQSHVIEPVAASNKVPIPASEVLGVDPKDPDDGFPILIAAEGGGIHAGLWAAHVLEELMSDPGEKMMDHENKEIVWGHEFLKRVRCVSGVSGGSYGLMYFVNTMAQGKPDLQSHALTQASGASSLGAVVHGLVFHDILSGVIPVSQGTDRGVSMEQDWLQHSPGLKGVLLSDWIAGVKTRKCPAVLFNATSVERGTPLVFGNTSFDPAAGDVQDWLYAPQGGYSIPVVSAARASASFPFVTPAARVRNEAREEHAVDGGYFDNYGMAVLTRWLHGALITLRAQSLDPVHPPPSGLQCPQQVLVIQIQSGAAPRPQNISWDGNDQVRASQIPAPLAEGIITELTAPLQALMSVRTTGQRQHNSDDFEMLTDIWWPKNRPNQLGEPGKVNIENAVFAFRGSPPLSWHLTDSERNQVTSVKISERHPSSLGVVRRYLKRAVEKSIKDKQARAAAAASAKP